MLSLKRWWPWKIKDVAKGSYKTRRLLHFTLSLFDLFCSIVHQRSEDRKGKFFLLFFSFSVHPLSWRTHVVSFRWRWRSRDHPQMNSACGSRGWEVTHSLGLFHLWKETFNWSIAPERAANYTWGQILPESHIVTSCRFCTGRSDWKQCWLTVAVGPGVSYWFYCGVANRNLSKRLLECLSGLKRFHLSLVSIFSKPFYSLSENL